MIIYLGVFVTLTIAMIGWPGSFRTPFPIGGTEPWVRHGLMVLFLWMIFGVQFVRWIRWRRSDPNAEGWQQPPASALVPEQEDHDAPIGLAVRLRRRRSSENRGDGREPSPAIRQEAPVTQYEERGAFIGLAVGVPISLVVAALLVSHGKPDLVPLAVFALLGVSIFAGGRLGARRRPRDTPQSSL
jgi:hypothetical protein